jgi:pSer/pThr/pTyr-binding forkhead associated (FHA) protein
MEACRCKKKKKTERSFILASHDGPVLRIGRDKTNHIQIDELSVSRFHCKISFHPEKD